MAKKRYTAEQIIAKLREVEVALAKGGSIGQAWTSRRSWIVMLFQAKKTAAE